MTSGNWLTAALGVSMAVNVYLFATRPPTSAEQAPDTTSGDRHHDALGDGAPHAAPSSHATGALRAPAAPQLATAGSGQRDDDSVEREAELAAQLAAVEADLAARRPLEEQFQLHTARSLAVEAQIQGELDQVFGTKPGAKPAYTVECHGQVCQLRAAADLDVDAWMSALQHEHREPFDRMAFHAGGTTYLGVRTSEQREAARYVRALFAAIRSSTGVEDCERRPSERGQVVLTVELSLDRRVSIAMTGTLADKDFGACLRPVLERASSQAPPVPASIQQLTADVLVLNPTSPSNEPRRRPPSLAAGPASAALSSTR